MQQIRRGSVVSWATIALSLWMLASASGAIWIEDWHGAGLRSYPPSSLIGGRAGKWRVADTTTGCTTNLDRAAIVLTPAGQQLLLTTTNFGRCVLPGLTVRLQGSPKLTLQPGSMLSLVATGFVLAPTGSDSARIQLQIRDQSGNELVYVFRSVNRPASTSLTVVPLPGQNYRTNGYHEIFLAGANGPGGEYLRNVHDDFRAVPTVGTNAVIVTNLSFTILGVGQAALAQLRLGTGLTATPPRIIVEPSDRLAPTGGVGRLEVEAIGTLPLSYEWQKDEWPIPGADAATLLVGPMTPTSVDRYRVIARNAGGAITSRWARLSLVALPTLHLNPGDVTVTAGEEATLQALATSVVGPVRYQWQRDGNNIPGATAATLTLAQASPDEGGLYTVMASDGVGTVESPPALVTVVNPSQALRIFEVTNGISVEWPTRRGTNYQVEYSYDLANWWSQELPVVGSGNLLVQEFWLPEKPGWYRPVVKGLRTTNDWVGLTYGNGIYLAHDVDGEVAVSVDGHHWRTTGARLTAAPIVFGNGKFVTWQRDSSGSVCLSSTDGVFWTRRPLPGDIALLCWGDGVFFGVGAGLTMESTDALNWTARASTLPEGKMDSVLFADGLLLVGLGNSRLPHYAYLSSDRGATWNFRIVAFRFSRTVYAHDVFVGVGISDTTNGPVGVIALSTNGVLWRIQNLGALPPLRDLTYENNLLTAVGEGGIVLLSTNATNWVRRPLGDPSQKVYQMVARPQAPIVIAGIPDLLAVADVPPYFRLREGLPPQGKVLSSARRTGAMTLPRELRFTAAGELSLPSVLWKTYQLERSANLVAWTAVGDPLPGTGAPLLWPAELLTDPSESFRVRLTDQLRRLADIYFGRFTNVDAFIRERDWMNASEVAVLERKGYDATGDYLPAAIVEPWITRLLEDDRKAWFFDGVIKGSLWRLTNDLVPALKVEKLKSVDYPEWNRWVTVGLTDHSYHLKNDQRTYGYLLDHRHYNEDGFRRESEVQTRTHVLEMYLSEAYRISRTQNWMEESQGLYGLGKDWVNLSSNSVRAPEGFSEVISTTKGLSPSIVQLSNSREVIAGEEVILVGAARGTEPISYQWLHQGIVLPGATNRELILEHFALPESGRYTLHASNRAGSVTSLPVELSLLPPPQPPSLAAEPQNQLARLDESVVFSIAALGSGPFNYDWYWNGTRLDGHYEEKLRLDQIQARDAGEYWAVVSDPRGAVTSGVARLSLNLPPAIVRSPVSLVVAAGSAPSLEVVAGGTEPLTYQWQGPRGPGTVGSDPRLILPAVNFGEAGDYFVVVANSAGTATSAVAHVTVLEPVRISDQPRSSVVLPGTDVSFAVVVTGQGSLLYQWYHGDNLLLGETGPELQVSSASFPDAGAYFVRVQNEVTVVTSAVAVLSVLLPPVIMRQPAATNVNAGQKAGLSVEAIGSSALSFQWWHEAVPIPEATNDVLSFEHAQPAQSGRYSVVVSNLVGTVSSLAVVLNVVPERRLPTLTVLEPRPKARRPGNTVLIRGQAADDTGLDRVEYQREDGSFVRALGTTNWSTVIDFAAGPQLVTVRSVDTSGNVSVPVKIPFTVVVLSPLHVTIAGSGTVAPALNGTLCEIARTYRLTARPGVGYLFRGWQGGVESASPTLSFIMSSNLILAASFVPNPFPARRGIYEGLIQSSSSEGNSVRSLGVIKIALTTRGTFSGTLSLAEGRYAGAGTLGPDGRGHSHLARPGKGDLELSLELGEGLEELAGSIHAATWNGNFSIQRSHFDARLRPAPNAGNYVLSFPNVPGPDQAAGDGYGVVAVNSAGAVTLRGSWTGGTALKQQSFLRADGHWIFHVELPRGGGLVVGNIGGVSDGGSWDGLVTWLHLTGPGSETPGLATEIPVEGERLLGIASEARYGPALGEVTLGGVNPPARIAIAIDASDRVMPAPSAWQLVLTLNRSSGEMRGSFVHPLNGRVIPFAGVQLPQRGQAAGYWRDQNQSGFVRLQKF